MRWPDASCHGETPITFLVLSRSLRKFRKDDKPCSLPSFRLHPRGGRHFLFALFFFLLLHFCTVRYVTLRYLAGLMFQFLWDVSLWDFNLYCNSLGSSFEIISQATWPHEVRSLASEFLKRPIHVQTGAVHEMTVPAASRKGQGVKLWIHTILAGMHPWSPTP